MHVENRKIEYMRLYYCVVLQVLKRNYRLQVKKLKLEISYKQNSTHQIIEQLHSLTFRITTPTDTLKLLLLKHCDYERPYYLKSIDLNNIKSQDSRIMTPFTSNTLQISYYGFDI